MSVAMMLVDPYDVFGYYYYSVLTSREDLTIAGLGQRGSIKERQIIRMNVSAASQHTQHHINIELWHLSIQ